MKTIVSIIFIIVITIILTPVTFAQQATLSLSPSSGTVNRSCPFSVDIVLNTGGAQTDGTDAILTYDTSRFSAASITNGSVYPDYPGSSIDEASGKITVFGLASVTSAFSGQGTFATINFLVKENAPTGVSQVKFDFDSNDKTKTTDSNVVQRSTLVADILNSVVNGSYTVGTGSCSQQTVVSTGGSAGTGIGTGTKLGKGGLETTPSGEFKTLPPAGTEEFTAMLTIVGGVLTILGILGLALL